MRRHVIGRRLLQAGHPANAHRAAQALIIGAGRSRNSAVTGDGCHADPSFRQKRSDRERTDEHYAAEPTDDHVRRARPTLAAAARGSQGPRR